MKKTFLYDEHIALGAKMVEFGGWEMPVQYKSILDEHKNVRENVGIFDVSHMGQVFVSGDEALNFLQKIVPQDVSKFSLNHAHYCQLPYSNGTLVDDLIIYKLENEYLIIVNASRREADVDWFKMNLQGYNAKIEDKSDEFSMIALQGPKALEVIEKAGIKKENQPKFFTISETKLFGFDIYLCRTGYTGEDGFEIICKNSDVVEIWRKLLELGKEFSITPVGLGARDTLRLEAALCLYGSDIDEETTPIEAGLGWSVPKDKKEDYNGKKVILGQKNGEIPLTKKLFAFEMIDKAIARHGAKVFIDGRECGCVTSGSISPTLGKNIGLCLISFVGECEDLETSLNTNEKSIGTIVQIMVRNKLYNAKIVKKPFVEKKYVK